MCFSNVLLGINVVVKMEASVEGAASVTVSQPVNVEAFTTQIEAVITTGGIFSISRNIYAALKK